MAKAPTTSRATRTAAVAAPATDAPAPDAPAGDAPEPDAPLTDDPAQVLRIRMLVGQEGPAISRVRGQELTIGAEIDADEAQRLVDADFAEEV